MNMSKIYCDNPEYRQHIAELATSVFLTKLREPDEAASTEDVQTFMKNVQHLEKHITEIAIKLHKRFGVPIPIIHSEINECVDFLPKDDLIKSLHYQDSGRLH